jgi:hypothetical protein
MNRPRPTGLCSLCGSYLLLANVSLLGERCRHNAEGQRDCRGVYVRPRGDGRWAACRPCEGTGRKDAQNCRPCQGSGWYYLQDGVPY